MPGLVGLITKMPRAWAEPRLLRMLKVIRHEAFYEAGTWIDEQSGLYVAWTARASSFCAGMPIRNERGEIVLVFSGKNTRTQPGFVTSARRATKSLPTDLRT